MLGLVTSAVSSATTAAFVHAKAHLAQNSNISLPADTKRSFKNQRDEQEKQLYSALFEAVWLTLSQFGMSRKHLQCQWCGVKSDYLFPVKAVSTVFKANMLAVLRHRELTIPSGYPDEKGLVCLQQTLFVLGRNRS
ncbi:hypothetical protein AWJ07_00350 [Shewanella frigidimarina]|uniref:Uncharacterized protein n=1 Tax=Shewanella frigidimarina TaxID=56812 RepID=A0A106C2L2_SHEFR|nr:hypothetical protein AWJ07_00350 [Shewanella frigidimarina]